DYVTGLMEGMDLTEDQEQEILDLIRAKNSYGLKAAAERAGLSDWECEALAALPGMYGKFSETLKEAVKYVKNSTMERAVADLGKLYHAMRSLGLEENLQLDFSLLNNIDYYNGIIFQGYLEQLPGNVLAGGQYDGMVKKLGKKCDGIGFAIYLSEMSRIPLKQQEYDVEALILYDETADFSQLILQANSLIKQGMRVRVERQLPNQLRCEKLYRFEKGELKELDREAVAAEKEVQ
ncbi:MAG: ATP phosphoribosyltransferase regulatory subunit, partial [Firmicutes bacterium]|nr:ATP phosphoribosyltransferase regulatory subunit [Bacillota bacterium]